MNTELTQAQKQHAHGMIERLAPEKLSAIVGLLESMLDPLDRALATAAIDDETVSEEEREDIETSRKWFQDNKGNPFDEVLSELGISMEEVTNKLLVDGLASFQKSFDQLTAGLAKKMSLLVHAT